MIEKHITRDISKYEAKLIGPFTTRQIIFGLPGLGLGIAAYFLFADKLGEKALLVGMLIAFPFLLFGYWKPYNMPLEKFLKSAFTSLVLSPTVRKYKTENTYSEHLKSIKYEPKASSKKYRSKNGECRKV